MRRLLPIILLFVFATVCMSGCRDAETRRTLRRMMGSTVVLPEKVTCVQNGEVFPMPEELRSRPKLIVFVDSTECSKCRIDNFVRYGSLFDLSRDTGAFEMMFLLSTKKIDYRNILEHLVESNPPYPVFLDSENSFRVDNPMIPDNSAMHTITVDSDNRVLLVGDPIYNESIMNLFGNMFNP